LPPREVERHGQGAWLVGHSLGGFLSVMCAARHPQLGGHPVKGVLLIDSPVLGGWRARTLELVKRTQLVGSVSPGKVSRRRRNSWPDATAAFEHFAHKKAFARWDPQVLRDYIAHGTHDAPHDHPQRRACCFDRDVETAIYNTLPHNLDRLLRRHPLQCPVAFMGGTQSQEMKQVGMTMTHRLVGKDHPERQLMIEGSHLFPMEKPQETAAAIGMVSTVLGMLLVNFMLVPPYGSFAFDNPVEAFWLNLWHFLTQLVVVGAIWWMQGQNQRLRQLHDDLEASRKRFRDTFEHAAAGITQVDLRGNLTLVNQTFCQLVGYSEDELLHMRFQDFTHPDDVHPDEALLEQVLQGQRDRYSIEKRYMRKDGQLVWAHLTVAVVRRSPDVPEYFVSVVQDISAIKAAEAALRKSERLMRQAHTLAGLRQLGGRCASRTGSARSKAPTSNSACPGSEFSGSGPDGPGASFGPRAHPQRLDGRHQGPSTLQLDLPGHIDGQDRWFSVRAEFERDSPKAAPCTPLA
jgi:PAS domain S-box-containing protein